MQKTRFKIFTEYYNELEDIINNWLDSGDYYVVNYKLSKESSFMTVVLEYVETFPRKILIEKITKQEQQEERELRGPPAIPDIPCEQMVGSERDRIEDLRYSLLGRI